MSTLQQPLPNVHSAFCMRVDVCVHWLPSPATQDATKGPREKLLYIPCIIPDHSRPDYVATVDVDPASSEFGKVIHRTHLKEAGDEPHHSGELTAPCDCPCTDCTRSCQHTQAGTHAPHALVTTPSSASFSSCRAWAARACMASTSPPTPARPPLPTYVLEVPFIMDSHTNNTPHRLWSLKRLSKRPA